ncbi:MAG: hypothetical protein ABS46_03315 [Cytophagaceae bacterium SCN 52-12]|nr:MAG: hypothetical protein ABS46_03315 [Cytophagaceae bacterium SCN 52-12]
MAGYKYDIHAASRDRSLWNRLIEGNKSALGELFDCYATDLFAYGFRICNERELVKDIVQDVFVELWARHPRLSPDVKVKFYLYKCVRNALSGHRERSNTVSLDFPDELLLAGSEPSAEAVLVDQENTSLEKQQLNRVISRLSEREREVITLKYYSGLKLKDIAALLELREQTVANTLQNALTKLRKYLVIGFIWVLQVFF